MIYFLSVIFFGLAFSFFAVFIYRLKRKTILIILAFAGGALLFSWSPWFLLLFCIAGFSFSLLRTVFLKKAREREIREHLPFVLDSLTLSVEAGLDFLSAIGRIVEKGKKTLLRDELARMIGQIKIGKSRGSALLEFKERMAVAAVDSFVSLLVQAETLGASIGPLLRAHSKKVRSERFQMAERAGAAASQKLLIPLIFCIMPSVFVVIFGPLFLMWRSGELTQMVGL